MHKNTYRTLVIGILCFMLTAGVMLGYRFGRNIAKDDKNLKFDISKQDNSLSIEDVAVNSEYERKEEFKIVKKLKYSLCSHEDYTEDIIVSTSIDKALEEISSDYEIESKSEKSAIVSKKNHGYCLNHYLVKINDEKVVIFKLIDKENMEIYSILDVPINILRDDVLEDLKKGIEVYGMDKLNEIIQELES